MRKDSPLTLGHRTNHSDNDDRERIRLTGPKALRDTSMKGRFVLIWVLTVRE